MAELFSKNRFLEIFHNQGGGFQLILGASLLSVVPFLVEFSHLDAFANGFYRMIIGGGVLLGMTIFRKESLPEPYICLFCIVAGLAIALDTLLWNQSVIYIGSGIASVLSNLEVVFMIIMGAVFFKERLSLKFFLLFAVIMLGVYLLALPHLEGMHLHSKIGVYLAIVASFVYSVYLLILKYITNRSKNLIVSPMSILAVICLAAAGFLASFMIFIPETSFRLVESQSIVCVVLNGLLGQVIAWILITKALKKLSFSTSGLLMLAQPALCFVFDCMFLGRNTRVLQILGCTVALLAIYGVMRLEKKEEIYSEEGVK